MVATRRAGCAHSRIECAAPGLFLASRAGGARPDTQGSMWAATGLGKGCSPSGWGGRQRDRCGIESRQQRQP
eukprot:scaffold16350_cov101-Isochrysis_galbana.AAC.2